MTKEGQVRERGSEEIVVSLEKISFIRNGKPILQDVSLKIGKKERWLLLGPNGSGKSTLLSLLSGYQWPSSGKIILFGEYLGGIDLQLLRSRLAIFQPAQQLGLDHYHPRLTALDVILTGSDGTIACYRRYPPETVKRAISLYENFFTEGLSFTLESNFSKLSSGERRKVLLLRLFMTDPELVVLDEPYESLDIPSRLEFEEILARWGAATSTPILTVLHRVEEIPPFTTHILMLKEGKSLCLGKIEEILNSENLSHLYGVSLQVGCQQKRYYCLPLLAKTDN